MLDILNATIDLGEKFSSIFERVRKKLLGSKSDAFDKLTEATEEIEKFYQSANSEISNFLGLDFSSTTNSQTKQSLYGILSGMMSVRIEQARGHCHKFRMIYDKYLDKWFSSRLEPAEFSQVKYLFDDLSVQDANMLRATEQLEQNLKDKAQHLIDFVNAGDSDSAVKYQLQNNQDLLTVQQRINTLLLQLMKLKNEFMQIAGI